MSFTKHTCDKCGGRMATLSSLNLLLCADCKHSRQFNLDKGQPSVLIQGMKGQ